MSAARTMSRLPRLAASALALLLVAVVAGCASIPLSGSVREGVTDIGEENQPFAFRPAGPTAGATAEEIVRGFVAAAVRPQDRYETAREFLSTDLAESWNPDAGVLLHESPNIVRDDGGDRFELAVSVIGRVAQGGGYLEYGTAYQSTLGYHLVQVDGEWRIDEAPDGVVLLRQTFERLYAQRTLYFYDPGFDHLVPDVRWFLNGTETPTRIVQALLAGPAQPLAAPALASAFPAGTSLATESVRVQSGGEVVVDLDAQIARAELAAQRLMKLQLSRSLVGGSVVSVQMRAGGVDLEVPDLTGGGPTIGDQVDPRAAVGTADTFGWVTGGEITPIGSLTADILALQPSAVALDAEAGRAAVRSEAGVSFVDGSGSVLVDSRAGLLAPVLDSRGFVWSVAQDDPRALQVSDSAGNVTPVVGITGDVGSLVSIGASRDGTRLLVYGAAGGTPVLRVYGVIRDADERPTGLSDTWFDLVPAEGVPVQATWVDDTRIASLASSTSGDSRVSMQVIGGASESLSRPDRSVTIIGANGESGLRVLTEAGVLLALRGAGWEEVARDVLYVANQR
jgi:hypothetical protein